MIILRRHKIKFYTTLILTFLVFLVMGFCVLLALLKQPGGQDFKAKSILFILFIPGSLFMAFYTLFKYFKNVPPVRADDNFIFFNDKGFALGDIEDIQFSGKVNFPYLLSYPMEATAIVFKSGLIKHIFDDMYENASELKYFLHARMLPGEKNNIENVYPVSQEELDSEYFETYTGNQFFSLRGISTWGIICLFGYLAFYGKKKLSAGGIVVCLFFAFMWFIGHSFFVYYFKLSHSFLVIRNQNFFWIRKAYRISNIREVVFETRHKMPNYLRVITKDFKNKRYPAASLRDKTWLGMKDKLESLGINVRNECI